MFTDVIARAETEGHVYVDGIVDRAGTHGVYVYYPQIGSSDVIIDRDAAHEIASRLFLSDKIEKVYFGTTSLRGLGLKSFVGCHRLTDVELMYGGKDDLALIVRRELTESDYVGLLDVASRFDAHVLAAETARVPLDRVSMGALVPPGFLECFYRMRAVRALALRAKRLQRASCALPEAPSMFDRLSLGLAGPEVDGFVNDGRLVFPKFAVIGGKTRRIGHKAGSFNTMNIPHGEKRARVTSRFENGSVVSFDFNAIDYRCIVAAVPKLREIYAGCDDFHNRTVELLTGKSVVTNDMRDVFKSLTYVYFYGGSVESCQKTTGLSRQNVELLLSLFKSKLSGVEELRDAFWNGSMPELPSDMERPEIELAEHAGARLAYFAQTCSSHAFKVAVVALCERLAESYAKSKLMFTVHDEVLVDCHPDELWLMHVLRTTMENAASECFGTKFAVKMKVGRSYGDM